MGPDPDEWSLERLLDERGQRLMRVAVALTGSRADGEDLLQAALERLLRNWRRIETDPEGYLWRALYNLAADGWLLNPIRHVAHRFADPAVPRHVIEQFQVMNVHTIDSADTRRSFIN